MKGADYNWSRIAILPKVMPILFSVRIRQIDDRTKRIIRTPINFDSRYLTNLPETAANSIQHPAKFVFAEEIMGVLNFLQFPLS